MKKAITRSLPLALLAGTLTLWSCEKAAQPEPGPVSTVAPALQQATETLSLKQAAWKLFIEQVGRGERIDPLGQYVSKATQVDRKNGTPLRRPKVEPDARWYQKVTRRSGNGTTTTMTAMTDGECDPLAIECVGTGGGGGDGIFKTFTSSENQGGAGQIHDLKLITGTPEDNTTSAQVVLGGASYTKLNADLNKGSGGAYIYLCFQRNSAQVLSGLEYYQGQPYSAPSDFLTNFQTKNGSTFSTPTASIYFFDIWVPNQNPYYSWSTLDLNGGAGGEYIYSFQSKTPFVRQQSGGTVARPAFSEVGILSGNSSSIQPPSGWNKYPNDLNEGAGGDFIYFCYKY